MSWVVILAVVAVGSPFAYLLGNIAGTLRACHKELVHIRLATESLHDQTIPEILTRRAERAARRH